MKKAKMHIIQMEAADVLTTSAGTTASACDNMKNHFLAQGSPYTFNYGSTDYSWHYSSTPFDPSGKTVIDVVKYWRSNGGWTTDSKVITYALDVDGGSNISAGQWLTDSPLDSIYIQLCTDGTHDYIN